MTRLLALIAAAVAALAVLDWWRARLPEPEPWVEPEDGVQVDLGVLERLDRIVTGGGR